LIPFFEAGKVQKAGLPPAERSHLVKELFIEDLKKVQGGKQSEIICKCCRPTTLACCEEANGCSGNCCV
jgi:hypothetical protein